MSADAVCRFRPPDDGRLVIWELTELCNLACLHCCTNSSPRVPTKDDAKLEHIVAALEDVEAARIREIYFTGGEPFVRKDFLDIVEAACSQPAEVYVATNGTLLTERSVERLKGLGIKTITISLDGHTAELHNRLRLHPTAFDRAVRGIRLCVEAGMPIRVSHMITPDNTDHVEDMCRFVADLGVRSLALNIVISAGRADSERQTLLDGARTDEVLGRVVQMQLELAPRMRIDHSLAGDHSGAPVGCPAGARVAHIAGNGDVSVCSWLYKLDRERFSIGNIKRNSLQASLDGWSGCMESVPAIDTECPIPRVIESRGHPLPLAL
jgi:MoaA/NifB/PqqE/SkfB family radical SAM enzyme